MYFEPAVNTKHENKREMTIYLPNLFWQKYLSESTGIVFQGDLKPRASPLADRYAVKSDTDLGRTDQTHILYRLTKTSIYP